MLVRLLIYIKHHFKFIWQVIEWLNAALFKILCSHKFNQSMADVIKQYGLPGYAFRQLTATDLGALYTLINSQTEGRLAWFKPHAFDIISLRKAFRNPAFIMMGAYDGSRLVGYFFLRCFWNKKCFVGRLVDEGYQNKGIGKMMNNIMYNIAWESGFRCLSTISKNNNLVMGAHAHNSTMKILKELDNDYLFVEFIKPHIEKQKTL